MFNWMKSVAVQLSRSRIASDSAMDQPTTRSSTQDEYVERYQPYQQVVTPVEAKLNNGSTTEMKKVPEMLDEADNYIKENEVLSFMKLFQTNSKLLSYVNVRNLFGYTLLQKAVIGNCLDIVRFLVEIGADINGPICGRPLHLASKLGNSNMLELLLNLGADPDVLSGVCYPGDHCGTTSLYDPILEMWTSKCACDLFTTGSVPKRKFEYPLFYAVSSDDVDSVELLMSKGIMRLHKPKPLLHLSCLLGARNCVCMFRDMCPNDVSLKDEEGHTPVMYAVKHNVDIVKYLVSNGADVLVKSEKEETLLHLAINQRNVMFDVSNVISYLLRCGLGMYVNSLDNAGLTPLTCLLKQMHKSTDAYIRQMEDERSKFLDRAHHEETISVCQMLLEAGANPNIPDKLGQTSLHILLGNPTGIKSWKQKLDLACLLLPHLLSKGANPNIKTFCGSYVVEDFLEATLCHIFPSPMLPSVILGLDYTTSYVINVLRQLAKAGADLGACSTCLVHLTASNQLSVLSDIEHLLHSRDQMEQDTTKILSGFEKVIRVLVVECGAPINKCGCQYSVFNSIYYRLVCHLGIVAYDNINSVILMLLQCGTDINTGSKAEHLDKFAIRPNNINLGSPPLQHLFYLMLTTDCYNCDKLMDLVMIFIHVMDPELVLQCLYLVMVYIDNKKDDKSRYVSGFVNHLMSTPLSLQHHCRTEIYKSLKKKLYLVPNLPLPLYLKKYILEMK